MTSSGGSGVPGAGGRRPGVVSSTLRELVAEGRQLYGWIDFGSHQVFDEATLHTQQMIKYALDRKNILTPGRGI